MGTTKVLVTGAAGLLGRHLTDAAPADVEIIRTWRDTPLSPADRVSDHRVDLADAQAVSRLVETAGSDVVVHTAYDKRDHRRGIVEASTNVAAACAQTGAALVHLSSDVVFDGEHAPYTEDHVLCPVSPYGVAKARAEAEVTGRVPDAALIRTSLLCDATPPDAGTAWILDALDNRDPVTLFIDEVRQPARVDDLAARIWSLTGRSRADRAGPWHLVGPDALNRYEIGRIVAEATGREPSALRPGRSAELDEPRPRDLRLVVTRPDTPLAPNRSIGTLFDMERSEG